MNLLTGVWGYAIAAVVSALVGIFGTWYVVSNVKNKEIAQLELKQNQAEKTNITASLSQLTGFISQMHNADTNYQTELKSINDNFAAVKKGIANVKPLPLDCKPTADRVRFLSDTVAATNKAAAPAR